MSPEEAASTDEASEPVFSDIELDGTHVVVGAGGALGAAVVEILAAGSRRVKALLFDDSDRITTNGIEAVVVDPFEPESIADASRGATVVYDCFEPTYASWKKSYKEVTGNITLATIQLEARAVFASHLISTAADNERSEREVLDAQGSGLSRTAVARFPQLFGRGVINPLYKQIFDAAIDGKKAHWVGDLDVRRSFLDVEDAARAMLVLAENDKSFGRAWNVASPSGLSGREFIELAFKAVGNEPKVGKWGRGIVMTGSLLAPATRSILEMPYDYYAPFSLDGTEFAEAFPAFSYSEAQRTMEKSLDWYKQRISTGHQTR
jgi:nucleoside-diphosphate-sugar epimerase